ncbi:alpha/beta hydrolase [Polaribacter undariae]|uniref:Alpha/beta hydrolase n=1 Tax=Polaribacter sejongensis TaxID=985043 RepID=A0AAJ1QWF3_9FLAO|nr:alpha/beta hydrolase [Polaribacter undariae]MDN3618841.1 alpha/beta hydrolase [Polaribacter undariae]UWD32931.1 alpha/beta hydrolase [Polaribacter undariae]
MKLRLIFLFMIISFGKLQAQNEVISLWKIVPNSIETSEEEFIEHGDIIKISKVKKPTLEIYAPSKRNATDKAVLIYPGGGYTMLAYDWEGTEIAKWFNSKGITAFVLKYRLPNSKSQKTPNKAPLQDAQRAMRWVRFNADKFGINPNKIGVIGFSAGGHLAATLGTQFDTKNNFKEEPIDTISARPDFMALIYPVITMKDDYTHKGSRNQLISKKPTQKLIKQYSNELQVTENTPPTFLVHSSNDSAVPVENSLQFYKALNDKKVKVEMHIYPYGGHGFSLAVNQKGYLHTWLDRLDDWLKTM